MEAETMKIVVDAETTKLLKLLEDKGDALIDLDEVFAMAAESHPDLFLWDGKTLHHGEFKDLFGLAIGLGIPDYEMDNVFGKVNTFADMKKKFGG